MVTAALIKLSFLSSPVVPSDLPANDLVCLGNKSERRPMAYVLGYKLAVIGYWKDSSWPGQ
jgi:hypothetical protein